MVRAAFLIFGICFGYILIKSGVSNYDVIREMFLFQSFHLYGVLGVAVTTTFLVNLLIKRMRMKALLTNSPIEMSVKDVSKKQLYGGLTCGVGWAITGACPGPALAQIGYGSLAGIFTIVGVFIGVYLFGIQQRD